MKARPAKEPNKPVALPGFTLQEEFYSGRNSRIYRAIRQADGTSVIVKKIREDAEDSDAPERLQHEFEIAQKLATTHCAVKVQALEKHNGAWFLIMEDLPGEPLEAYAKDRDLDIAIFLKIAINIAMALEELRAHRVIHKDINPRNLIIDPQSLQIRIIDFGISAQLPAGVVALPAPNRVEGSLAYISPEQTGRTHSPLDFRTDYYAAGVSFYQMLCKRLPFAARDNMELIHCHLAHSPPLPQSLRADIPAVLQDILLKLMAKAPDERYQTATGLHADLRYCKEQYQQQKQLQAFTLDTYSAASCLRMPDKLIGREAELAALSQAYTRMLENPRETLEIVLLEGEIGTGKSALLNRFSEQFAERGGVMLTGSYERLQSNTPYLGLTVALNSFFSRLLTGSAAALADWRENLQKKLGDQAAYLGGMIPMLEYVIGQQDAAFNAAAKQIENRFLIAFHLLLNSIASADAPLVIHLRDLQWADTASLNLIRTLMGGANPYLLLILSYQPSELDEVHALESLLKEFAACRYPPTRINLDNLELAATGELIACMLNSDVLRIRELTELIYQKTAGNPAAVIEVMKALYAEDLLRYRLADDNQSSGWVWDAEAIKARQASINVIERLTEEVHKVSTESRQLLSMLACFGKKIEDQQLQKILASQQSSSRVFEVLSVLLNTGLLQIFDANGQLIQAYLEKLPEKFYLDFSHEKLRLAIYDALPKAQANQWHLQIGRALVCDENKTDVRFYEFVNHYNKGRTEIQSVEEAIQLAELNLAAGNKAKQAAAYSVAIDYFRIGSELLPVAIWQTHYRLAFDLYVGYAEMAGMAARFDIANQLFPLLHQHADSETDRQTIFLLQVSQAEQQGEYALAIEFGKQGLAALDIFAPTDAAAIEDEIQQAILTVQALLERTDLNKLDQRQAADTSADCALALMAGMASSAFAASQTKTLHWVSVRMAQISLERGHNEYSAYGYVSYASNILRGRLRDYKTAYVLGQHAVKLAENYRHKGLRGRALQVNSYGLVHWQRSFDEVAQGYLQAYELCVAGGELAVAAQTAYMYITDMVIAGKSLKRLKKEALSYGEFIKRYHRPYYYGAFQPSALQAIDNLLGLTLSPASFDSNDFREVDYLQRTNTAPLFVSRFYAAKIRSSFLFGLYTEGAAYLPHVDYVARIFGGMAIFPETYFYMALNQAACFPEKHAEHAAECLQLIETYAAEMHSWASRCESNYLAKAKLLDAELARLRGDEGAALNAYREGIAVALQYEFPNLAGVGNELCARYWLAKDEPEVAAVYLKHAYTNFKAWGADAKLHDLRGRYPQAFAEHNIQAGGETSEPRHTTWIGSQQALDFGAVMKATRAISGEIDLERLLKLLLQVLVENAGAQRVCLFLSHQDDYVLMGEFNVVEANAKVLQKIPLQQCVNVPHSLINLVSRTGETLVLADTEKDSRFAVDFAPEKIPAKSALCMPILVKKQGSGILYLENSLIKNAFTEERLEVLRILAAQAATSLENASLYANLNALNADLEARVLERTQELEQVHKQLVDKAHKAGMAEIATGVLHNIGNILNTVNTSCYSIQGLLKDSKVLGLTKANKLLMDNRDNLGEFFNTDPRAGKLLDYYSKLEQQTLKERQDMLDLCERLAQAIQNIRDAVAAQQSYAKRGVYTESLHLSDLVDDVLTLYMNPLSKSGIEVRTEYLHDPRVIVQKAKLVDIILNLLKNAKEAIDEVKATARWIDIKLWQNENNIFLRIADSGPGIAAEHADKIFSHGFTTKRLGHGFGLHSCANYMREMNGEISLDQQNDSAGAAFLLRLPLRTSD